MAQVTLSVDEAGEVFVETYDVEPLVTHLKEGTNGVTVYPLSEYTDELADVSVVFEYGEDYGTVLKRIGV